MRDRGGGDGYVVGRFGVGEDLDERWGCEEVAETTCQLGADRDMDDVMCIARSERMALVRIMRDDIPDSSQPKALAQRLRDTDIGILVDEVGGRVLGACEVDVRLVDDDDTLELGVVQDALDSVERDESTCRVARRADEEHLEVGVRIECGVHLNVSHRYAEGFRP